MGNRAVITFNTSPNAPCIYLHWNGGLDSVEAFLMAAKKLQLIKPTRAETMDAIADMLHNHFFAPGYSKTVTRLRYDQADAENGDNGVYIIDDDLNIVSRLYAPAREQNNHNRERIVSTILKSAKKEPGVQATTADVGYTIRDWLLNLDVCFLGDANDSGFVETLGYGNIDVIDVTDPSNPIILLDNGQRFRIAITSI